MGFDIWVFEMSATLSNLEKKIGFAFGNKDLLREALTHRSYLNEKPGGGAHNERLEFLGDAVLELSATDFLFHKFPDKPEGELTSIRSALVNHTMLVSVAREIGLEEHMFLSRGEARDEGRAREAILANAVEAMIGALYLDQGYGAADKFVKDRVLSHLEEVMRHQLFVDSKSALQEVVQEKMKITPTYQVLQESGPDHNKQFSVGVFFGDKMMAKGSGFSKQEAERAAAAKALSNLNNE